MDIKPQSSYLGILAVAGLQWFSAHFKQGSTPSNDSYLGEDHSFYTLTSTCRFLIMLRGKRKPSTAGPFPFPLLPSVILPLWSLRNFLQYQVLLLSHYLVAETWKKAQNGRKTAPNLWHFHKIQAIQVLLCHKTPSEQRWATSIISVLSLMQEQLIFHRSTGC